MSWLDRIENTIFTIRTGDGKMWYPDFPQGSESSTDFNVAVFDFINTAGSLVDRKKPKGDKYPLNFFFQGADNIDQANAFLVSAKDSRAWLVHHPYYGDIIGQPLSIARDSNVFNITRFAVDFTETIAPVFPKQTISVQDLITARTEEFHVLSASEYGVKTDLKAVDVNTVKDSASTVSALINKVVDATNYNQYQVVKNRALAKITDLILAPTDGIYALQSVLMEPALFAISMEYRYKLIGTIFNSVLNIVTLKQTRNNKFYFEAVGGIAVAALALALTAPVEGDFETRVQTDKFRTVLKSTFATYQSTLDDLYAKDVEPNKTYSPGPEVQEKLSSLIAVALNRLNDIAFSAKQERIVFTEKDEHLIVLVHKYIGLDQEDKNIDTFRKINNLRNKFLFLIPKGTQIRYYV